MAQNKQRQLDTKAWVIRVFCVCVAAALGLDILTQKRDCRLVNSQGLQSGTQLVAFAEASADHPG
jgi:hypothetical protein